MRLESAPVKDPDLDPGTLLEVAHEEIVGSPNVTQPITSKEVAESLSEPDLLLKERRLVYPGLPGDPGAFGIVDRVVVAPVLVQAADLPPVDTTRIVGLPVEHVGIDPADGEPPVVYAAPAILKEDAGAVRFGPEGVARDIESSLLIAGVECGRRDDGIREERESPVSVLFEQEDVAVELPGAAPRAAVAGEPHVPYDIDELVLGEPEKVLKFTLKGIYLLIECKRKEQPPYRVPVQCTGTGIWAVGWEGGYALRSPETY